MGAVRPEDPRDRARRLALRRRLLLWSAVPVLLLGILALRWLSLPFVAAGATSGFEEGDADRVVGRSRLLAPINVVERWKAPYDLGTGYAMRGEDDRARPQLEKALRRVDGAPEECAVRANLVLVVERQGAKAEGAGDTATSKARKDEVVAIVDAAPPECLQGGRDGQGGKASKQLSDARKRAGEGGEGEGGKPRNQPGDQPGEADTPSQDQESKLREKNAGGGREASTRRRFDEQVNDDPQGYVEKPW